MNEKFLNKAKEIIKRDRLIGIYTEDIQATHLKELGNNAYNLIFTPATLEINLSHIKEVVELVADELNITITEILVEL